MLDNKDEMAHFYDDDEDDSVTENDLLREVFDEVEITEEMILGGSYISYAGEPQMDAQSLVLFCNQLMLTEYPEEEWIYPLRIIVDRLTFGGIDPFAYEYAGMSGYPGENPLGRKSPSNLDAKFRSMNSVSLDGGENLVL